MRRRRCGSLCRMVDSTLFVSAAHAFSALVDRVPADRWDSPGLGDWDVRALTGHASRSLVTVSTYLLRPAATEAVATPGAYYRATATVATADASAVVDRGRQAGEALGDDPGASVRQLVAKVVAQLDRDDDPLIETIVGGMRLSAYLPTRTFELAVHSVDLAAATGVAFTCPADVLADTIALAGRIATARGDGEHVLMSLTGRRPLAAGFSVV